MRYRDSRGSMHARTFRTKTDASRWAKEVETDLRRGDWTDPRLARTTFGEWADAYMQTIVHLRKITRGDYERALRVHVLPTFGDWPIGEIEPIDVRRLFAQRQATGMAPKTLQKVRLVLRQVFETARESGAIKANPCAGIRLPRAQQKEPVFLNADQVELLAQTIKPPFGVLVRLAALTGMRSSELCGLKVGRLNLLKGTADVVEALTVVEGRLETGPTKTGARRTVSLTRTMCDDLGEHLARRAADLGRPLVGDDYVFTAPLGSALRRDLLYKRYFQPAVRAAGLPPALRLHDLRHTCAALMIELGAHPKVIQERLGHRSIMVTMDVYGHLFPSLNEALTERLDEAFLAARASRGDGASAPRGRPVAVIGNGADAPVLNARRRD